MAGLLLTISYRKKINPNRLRLLAGLGLTVLLLQGLPFTPAQADNAALQYDAAGNIQQRTTPLGATTYTYDALNRLIHEAGPAKTQSFTYDPNSNRLSDGLGSYAYPASSNQLQTRRGATVTTDAAGHITSDGAGHNFIYNQAGRLSQVFQGSSLLATYSYNYKGQRTRKVTTSAAPQGAQTVVYHYDLQGHLIAETTGNGTRLRTYVWRDDTPLAQIEYVPSRKILYYDVDHLNTPRAARDEAAKVVWRWEGDAFGATLPNEDPDGDGVKVTVNLRFAGQYYDQETSLHYNYYRDYDPGTGRFLQSDPIGLAGGLNTYTYVGGNPISLVDPLGLAGGAVRAPERSFQGSDESLQNLNDPGASGSRNNPANALCHLFADTCPSDFGPPSPLPEPPPRLICPKSCTANNSSGGCYYDIQRGPFIGPAPGFKK